MNPFLRTSLIIVVFLMGVALMVGGLFTGKHGATAGGLIVAGVSAQQWMASSRKRSRESKN